MGAITRANLQSRPFSGGFLFFASWFALPDPFVILANSSGLAHDSPSALPTRER
jgi:hypothetical protein